MGIMGVVSTGGALVRRGAPSPTGPIDIQRSSEWPVHHEQHEATARRAWYQLRPQLVRGVEAAGADTAVEAASFAGSKVGRE